jgi:acyl-CoA synthetase (AMP-forming)/AMP-acid ligase II/aryl carrier-like protein
VGTYILKPGTKQPVLRGAIGELCISGKLVGQGYRRRQELTKKRFQYLEEYGERIYRTGDLVRLNHDATFDFLGRTDDQVKLRGQRLEVSEVNEIIKKNIPEVADAVTLLLKHRTLENEHLVSFVAFRPQSRAESTVQCVWQPEYADLISKIQAACRERLPPYGVPSRIIPLNRIPLSVNHKVDINKLKDIYGQEAFQRPNVAPASMDHVHERWSPADYEIIRALADFLQVDVNTIMKKSNVFELGLDSISVIQLANVLRRRGFKSSKPSLIMKSTSTICCLISPC